MKEIKIFHECTADAKKIRQEVFVEEQGFQNEFDETDDRAIHCVCYVDGVPAAVGRTFRQEDGCFAIGRIAVRKPMRKTGLGRTVVLALEEAAKAAGAVETVLLAQLTAVEFYQTLGYAKAGTIVYDESCPHIQMRKKLSGDLE